MCLPSAIYLFLLGFAFSSSVSSETESLTANRAPSFAKKSRPRNDTALVKGEMEHRTKISTLSPRGLNQGNQAETQIKMLEVVSDRTLPIIQVRFGGQLLEVLLDTGAHYKYAAHAHEEAARSHLTDFSVAGSIPPNLQIRLGQVEMVTIQ